MTDDGPEPDEMFAEEVEVELRPQRRLRIWQLAPTRGPGRTRLPDVRIPGSLFDFGDSGAVIAMLGLLICSCAAGWGMMAARRVGYTWPGLPARRLRPQTGLAGRPRVCPGRGVVVVLAVWRVARLR
ncbi:hypothetical protein GCM10011428_37530 [Streptomyces violaceus]